MTAALAVAVAGPAMALAAGPGVLGPAVFWLENAPAVPNPTGSVRQLVKQPTAMLRELEVHVTTLTAGATSRPPHRHPNEELVVNRQSHLPGASRV